MFDPYSDWLGIPAEDQPPDHYRLLGLPLYEANPTAIARAADRQMGRIRARAAGERAADAVRLLEAIVAALRCLVDPDTRQAYDDSLRRRLESPDVPPVPDESLADPLAETDVVRGVEFGDYWLLDLLAGDASGDVHRAAHRRTHRVVAIKRMRPSGQLSGEQIERFFRKVRILATLAHPNLVSAHHAGQDGGRYFLVMDYIDGKDLSRLLKEQGPFAIQSAVSYVLQAAAALGCLHDHHILHRNVKPSNLMLDPHGTIRVVGLGMARMEAAAHEPTLTQAGAIVGTPDFMAPEQIANPSGVDVRADIYSLGCTLFSLLTGQAPYPEASAVQKMLAHRQAKVPSARALRPEVPRAIDQVIAKCMAKDPHQRYASMDELATELAASVGRVVGS